MNYLSKKKVSVYPGYNVFRYSFYIKGLWSAFSAKDLKYSSEGFPKFHHHCLPIIIGKNPNLRIYISAGDGPGYNEAGLEWCDVYAKRTLIKEKIPEKFASKIIPMGPHFGIRIWGYIPALYHSIKTFIMCPQCIENPKQHFINYIRQYRSRLPEEKIFPGASKEDYIFYASTLYPTHPEYNRYRANFIEASRSTEGVLFEGGLIRTDNFRVENYKDITITTRYRINEWWEKTKLSLVSYWAPGDQGAMTLKLAEFLACGKAIIAVPIRQEMLPSPLVHEEHVHFVDGSVASIKAAIQLLKENRSYRNKLELNARKYYEKWLAPERAVLRFIKEGCIRKKIDIDSLL